MTSTAPTLEHPTMGQLFENAPLTDREREKDAELARKLRTKRRHEYKRAGKAQVRAMRRNRWASQRRNGRDQRERHYHQRALSAKRKVTNPDRKLTSAWRAYSLFSAGASLVSCAAIVWCAITVGMSLEIGFAGYMVEGLFSVLLLISLGTQVYATRHNRPIQWWQYVLDGFLLAASLVLNVVPWGAKTAWTELAQLPAHALPPLALVASVAMQYVLSKVFGGILADAHENQTTTGEELDQHLDHDLDLVEQPPAHPDQTSDREVPNAAPEHDLGAIDYETNDAWSGAVHTEAGHGQALPDHGRDTSQDTADQIDHTETTPETVQVTSWSAHSDHDWSDNPTTTIEPIPPQPTKTPVTNSTGATRPPWSSNGSAAPQLDHTPDNIPTAPSPTEGQTDETPSLSTKGWSPDDIAELLAPVAEALIAEGDFLSRTDVTNLTDVNSSTTAGKIQQLLKDRYPDHPDPVGRRKPDRTRTISHAIAGITGQRRLQSVR